MSTDLNQNDKLAEAVAVLVNQLKQFLSHLQKCASKDSIKEYFNEGEVRDYVTELSHVLNYKEGLEKARECLVNWQFINCTIAPLLFYAIVAEELEIQKTVLQILLLLVEAPPSLVDTRSKDRTSKCSTKLKESFIQPVIINNTQETSFQPEFPPENLNLLWFLGKVVVDNLKLVLYQGWISDSKTVIGQILTLIEELTSQGRDSTSLYSGHSDSYTVEKQIVSWLVSNKIYDAILVFLGAEYTRKSIPSSILGLMIAVIAGPCYNILEGIGPGFLSATIEENVECAQENANKRQISFPIKVEPNKRSERIMRWSSQHNSVIPILKVYKDGERKYGHWEERKGANITSLCDDLLKLATCSFRIKHSDNIAECLPTTCSATRENIQSQTILFVEELLDACIAFMLKWLLNTYTSLLSSDSSYVKKLPILRFPLIISCYVRIVYSAGFHSETIMHHLTQFLDERLLRFLVWAFSRSTEWEDQEMQHLFLTTLTDYLSILLALTSKNEEMLSESCLNISRLFERTEYPQWKFQAKQLVELFFEKEELHGPVVAYFRNLKLCKWHSSPFLFLCMQLLSILIGLHQILEQFLGSSMNVEKTRKRRKQVEDEEKLSVVRNMESHTKRMVHQSADFILTPLIRSQTFEILLLPFHELLSNDFKSVTKYEETFKALSISCRLCYISWKRLWNIACSHRLRPCLYSAKFLAFVYALNLPEAEQRFDTVFKDNGKFLSAMRGLSKEIADSFIDTFFQNVVVAADALFPINSATCLFYENMSNPSRTLSTVHYGENSDNPKRNRSVDSLAMDHSAGSTHEPGQGAGFIVDSTDHHHKISRNVLRRRMQVNDDDDDSELD